MLTVALTTLYIEQWHILRQIKRLDFNKGAGAVFYSITNCLFVNIILTQQKEFGFIATNTKGFINSHNFILLYNSLVGSNLEYCSVIWSPCYAVHSDTIGSVKKCLKCIYICTLSITHAYTHMHIHMVIQRKLSVILKHLV